MDQPIKVVLQRLTLSALEPTYGVILVNDTPRCVTFELPWKDNQPEVSCIPDDIYQVIPHNSEAHPNVWEITGVKNRTAILIHEANTVSDLLGCVGAGTSYFNGGILQSKAAIVLLRTVLPSHFTLNIINP